MAKAKSPTSVADITHKETKRTNIPTSEMESLMEDEDKTPIRMTLKRRNPDLDPQLVWRGKYEEEDHELQVLVPPLYIQEKVHPRALIEDLREASSTQVPDLFSDFNGLPSLDAKTEFYQHEQNWANRMILGDSLKAMGCLAEREGMRERVQCIYMDPPYGIKFNSNFQWSTTSRDVKDGNAKHITREPEQVKAFRDTWRDGIHSYLTYLRDRLLVARELLTESGSIFVQIGDENVHRVRAAMDEVFGGRNFVGLFIVQKTSAPTDKFVPVISDFIIWYAKSKEHAKYRQLFLPKEIGGIGGSQYSWFEDDKLNVRKLTKTERHSPAAIPSSGRVFAASDSTSSHEYSLGRIPVTYRGISYTPKARYWSTGPEGMNRVKCSNRLAPTGNTLFYRRYLDDFPVVLLTNVWTDTSSSFGQRLYVVQTNSKIVERCILMTTDPGDLVLDPTCGSGTTAYVAEQWGRRWITMDTSRVALALARARIMGARYPYYLLADSREGQLKEAEISRMAPSEAPTFEHVSQGFVYQRVPHITLKSIANNTEIDTIYEAQQPAVEMALAELNQALADHPTPFKVETGARKGDHIRFDATTEHTTLPSGEEFSAAELLEWEVPREAPQDWPNQAQQPLERFWKARIKRQQEIDASIAARADFEYLYDKPYEDKKKVRVAGPFTVESLTPHRMVGASPPDDSDEHVIRDQRGAYDAGTGAIPTKDFHALMLEQLRLAGVQQADKRSKIDFISLDGYPGHMICAEGYYQQGERSRRAAILIGPEHGTLSKSDLMAAAREAAECGFDVLIACAFNFDVLTTETNRLGKMPILKARMNADLHMSTDLKKAKSGNLFVIFGEPDIELLDAPDNQIRVKMLGIDIFDPRTGEVRSSEPDDLACWFIDTDYDMASFFVRHAYFLGASDPYKNLKTTLKGEIDDEAWQSLRSDTSRPFDKPAGGRIAVKAINHLGDEVMKVFTIR